MTDRLYQPPVAGSFSYLIMLETISDSSLALFPERRPTNTSGQRSILSSEYSPNSPSLSPSQSYGVCPVPSRSE